MRCTYVLPDGVTHTKGFVKDTDQAQRYFTLTDGSKPPSSQARNVINKQEDSDQMSDRKKIDLTKNVVFLLVRFFFF